jgi:hypothetical protein
LSSEKQKLQFKPPEVISFSFRSSAEQPFDDPLFPGFRGRKAQLPANLIFNLIGLPSLGIIFLKWVHGFPLGSFQKNLTFSMIHPFL